MAENRKAQRKKLLKTGLICYNQRHTVLPCTVREVSETGAKLLISDPTVIPDKFELNIELDGLWADCDVVWKTQSSIGVAFRTVEREKTSRRVQTLEQSTLDARQITAGRKDASGKRTESHRVGDDLPLSGKTILVVDDDPVFCRVAELSFSKAGARTVCATSGLEALEILETETVDAATIDLIMPEMDGFRLIAHLRHSQSTRELPIVVITSRYDASAKHEATLLRVSSYQIKPIVWPDLISTVAFCFEEGYAAGTREPAASDFDQTAVA